ncbi:TetR/AcrR family transcriptional regulator [Faecalicatena contorta]|uniref:TetR/AcrR family transcriptional regulator n=1 Tax=Faecalicatena contorta TaxID=39482 RepID=UPI00129D6AA9|nr:TetR/AcrR family transcriptional regulator C-terminal domain-containing protein [Faecalicatena contorta]MEE0202492.1 TetR/AcrR family transcriptional regulator C-terminal domain-containing protein [Muricomes sp.]MRM90149.1 TetR/AcrR family transcriptional regulator [Faecalicatena contorta]
MADLRKIKTKSLIQNALIELLKEKSIHCITITDICAKAQINRSTFYSHYEDINIFLEQTMRETAEGLTKAVSDSFENPNKLMKKGEAYECYYNWFCHVRDHGELFSLLLGPNGSLEFDALILQQGIDWYTTMLRPITYKFEDIIPLDVLTNYIIGAHYGLLKFYIKSNFKYSAEFMTKKMVNLTFNGIIPMMGILDE